jgi:hypothetical protein
MHCGEEDEERTIAASFLKATIFPEAVERA